MRLMKLSQVEQELGVCRNTLYEMRRAGLAMHNIGSGSKRPTLAVDRDELLAFMQRPLACDRPSPAIRVRHSRRPLKWQPRPVCV